MNCGIKWRSNKTLINSRFPNLCPFRFAKSGFGAKDARTNIFHTPLAWSWAAALLKKKYGPADICTLCVCAQISVNDSDVTRI